MGTIFIIDDDENMSACLKRQCGGNTTRAFSNAIEAMNAIAEGELPCCIFLDIILDGPDGFTFLNELASYPDTAKIPIIIISSLNLKNPDLRDYGVVGILEKDKMTPKEIRYYVNKYAA